MSTTNILDLNNRIDALEKKHDAGGSASDTTYDNTASGLTADNVQDAIDELKDDINDLEAWTDPGTKDATGNPIILTDGAAFNAVDLKVSFEPKQSGSGTPSPDNVRPITGLTECVVDVKDEEETTQDTATITFGQTVYGGSVDFKTGKVRVTHKIIDGGDLTYNYNAEKAVYGTNIISDMADPVAGKIQVKCSILNGLTPKTVDEMAEASDNSIAFNVSDNEFFRVKCTTYTSGTDMKTAMTGQKICYELATPTELTLTPAELELLKGYNYITTNGDNIELTYQPDTLKADILLTVSQLYGSKISIFDGILTGGDTGQVLTKTSDDNYDATWAALPATRTTKKQ